MKAVINKPIENYEGLRIICGEDNATGSYAMSLYIDFAKNPISEDASNDNDNFESPIDNVNSDGDRGGNSKPPITSSPVTSSTYRSQHYR